MPANFTYTNAPLHNSKTASLHNPMAYFFYKIVVSQNVIHLLVVSF